MKLGYLDEDKGIRNTFNRLFKSDFEVIMLDKPEKIQTLEMLLTEINRLKLDALAVDYKLADQGWVSYNGDEVVQMMSERKKFFPIFMLTSYPFDAFQKMENVFLVNEKTCFDNEEQIKKLKDQIKGAIEAYPRIVSKIEQKVKCLERKQSQGLSEEEEQELLKLHVELNQIDPESNPLTPDVMETSAVKNLKDLVTLSRQMLAQLQK